MNRRVRSMVTNSLGGLCAVAMMGLNAGGAAAADGKGNYIVRGIGAQPCTAYLDVVKTNDAKAIGPFIDWMEGYITAANAFTAGTYDASPVIPPGNMGALLRNVCSNNQNTRLETALRGLLQQLAPYKVAAETGRVEVTKGDHTAVIRQSTLRWMQDVLKQKGLYSGASDGQIGPQVHEALGAYQKSKGLPVTAVPDGATVAAMIQDDVAAKAGKAPAP